MENYYPTQDRKRAERFKAGDRVRYVKRTVPRGSECPVGTFGTVLGPSPDPWNVYDYEVKMDSCPTNHHFMSDTEIEPA